MTLSYRPAFHLVVALLLMAVLAGCQMRGAPAVAGTPTIESATESATAETAPPINPGTPVLLSPLPMTGTAVLEGRLLNGATGAPLPETGLQVAPIYWTSREPGTEEGQFILNTAQAPFTTSDAEGRFRFDTLADGDYVIVVGDVTMDYMVVTDAEGKNKVWTVSAASPVNAGDIPVMWQSGAP